jgi:hypothetical protein
MSNASTRQHQASHESATSAPLRSRQAPHTVTGSVHEAATAPLARAAREARRGNCCVANFADVAVRRSGTQTTQAKLKVSAAGAVHERQADSLADRVSRMSEGRVPSNSTGRPVTSGRDGGNMDHNTPSVAFDATIAGWDTRLQDAKDRAAAPSPRVLLVRDSAR